MNEDGLTKAERRELDEMTTNLKRGHAMREDYIETAEDVLAYAKLDQQFLVKDVVPEASLVFLAGRPGCGKSWLGYDLAFAVARARPWLIFKYVGTNGRPQPVLVLNFDNPRAEIARRFLRMGMQPSDPIHFHSGAKQGVDLPENFPPILKLPYSEELLLGIVDSIRPGLILIDSLRQSHTLDELSSMAMGRIISCLRRLTDYGATVVVIHHKRKEAKEKDGKSSSEHTDDESMRGSGEIVASADTILHVKLVKKTPAETSGELFIGKTRGFSPETETCDYAIRDDQDGRVGSTIVVPGGRLDVVLDQIKKFSPKGITRRDLLRRVSGLEPKRLTALVNLCIEFGRVKEVSRSGSTRVLVAVEKEPTL